MKEERADSDQLESNSQIPSHMTDTTNMKKQTYSYIGAQIQSHEIEHTLKAGFVITLVSDKCMRYKYLQGTLYSQNQRSRENWSACDNQSFEQFTDTYTIYSIAYNQVEVVEREAELEEAW